MAQDSKYNASFLSSLASSSSRPGTSQKRTASFAQLGDIDFGNIETGSQDISSRIHNKSVAFVSHMEKAALERKILTLESERKSLEVKLGLKDREIARLENDKLWLAERESEEKSEKESLRNKADSERKESSAIITTLRSQLSARTEELARLQEDFSAVKRSTSQTINEQKIHLLDVTRQTSLFEEEMKQLKEVLRERDEMVNTLRSELDTNDAFIALEPFPHSESSTDAAPQGWKIVQEELHRQSAYIQKIETENSRLKADVATLSDRYQSIQVLREEKLQLENKLRSMDDFRQRVVELEVENDQLRGQISTSSETDHRNAANKLLADLEALRFRNIHLEDSLGETRAESIVLNSQLAQCRTELVDGQQKLQTLEANSEEIKLELQRSKRRVEIAEGEIKFWKSTAALENGQPGESLKSQTEGASDIPEQAKHLVEQLKQELEISLTEISRLGGGYQRHDTRSWTDLFKSLNKEIKIKQQVEEELCTAQTQCTTLLDRIENLEQTLFELRGDIASGSHVPPNHRVLCLKENPFQQWVNTREELVNRLKKENEALLSRLTIWGKSDTENVHGDSEQSMDMTVAGAPVATTVPRESWEVERAEKLALEETLKQTNKRLLRLQQIFKAKAQEFKDTTSSILGYKLHFNTNGQVRLTSQYDLNTSFVFQPSENGEGKVNMQLVGAGDSSLDDLPRTVALWVEKRGSIPALMATVTLECFDKIWRARREEAGDEVF